jgi:branched-subunit amino acid aminotransferase/4-amino-4-deoxychorismate lyase
MSSTAGSPPRPRRQKQSRNAAIDSFELLETLGWQPATGFLLLDRHLQRLHDSASFFGYSCQTDSVRDALTTAVEGQSGPLRVRLLVDRLGRPRVEVMPLDATPVPLRVALAPHPIDPVDPFFLYKTTRRDCYERLRVAGSDETALWNPAGEITEALTANVVVERDGQRVTPPLRCGLLAGTMRAELLDRGEIVEAPLTVEEFTRAPRFWLINSVRGWREAVLVQL